MILEPIPPIDTVRSRPIALEVPMTELARTVGAVERAKRLLAATRELLRKVEEEPRRRG